VKREPSAPSISWRVSHAFVWTLVLVAASAVLTTACFALEILVFQRRSAALHEARRGARTAHEGMLDEETALRAWLVMRDPKYLDPMRNARLEIQEGHAVLDETVGTDREVAPLLLETRLAEQSWQTAWASVAEAARPDDPPSSEPFFAEGKTLFDAYRAQESKLNDALHAASDSTDRAQAWMLGAAALVQLSLFVVLGVFARHQRRVIHDTLEDPLDGLLAAMRGVRDGDLTTAIPVAGPSELRQIGEDLGKMTQALAGERARREVNEQRLRIILDAAREFSESLNLGYVLQSVARGAAAVTTGAAVDIWLVDEGATDVVCAFDSRGLKGEPVPGGPVERGRSIASRAVKRGRPVFDPPEGGPRDLVAFAAFPMIVGARAVGVLVLELLPGPKPKHPEIIEVVETLASHAAAAIESARLHRLAVERSHVDALTRLLNRHRLDEDLADECRRSARYGRPLSVVMMDVDHFKAFNDAHGHPAGDVVLQSVAEVLRLNVRATDSAYRYGGEEFLVLLRETDEVGASLLAERLRAALERTLARQRGGQGVTASFGVAQYGATRALPGPLVEAADRALYRAKREGRNRVVVASAAQQQEPA
jgi:diguanylate cyclase (GGDEF)-like protein